MSVIIPGVKMPNCCQDCFAYYDGYCEASEIIDDDGLPGHNAVSYKTYREQREAFCPLVEVPAHGRLGDFGVLREAVGKVELEAREEYYKLSDAEKECEYEMGVWDGIHMAAKILSTAPTIIPAEEVDT